MKTRELIAKLLTLPQDVEVLFELREGGDLPSYVDVTDAEIMGDEEQSAVRLSSNDPALRRIDT